MKAVEEDAMKRAEERKKKKEEARVWKEKGETLFNEGSFKEALEAFDKVVAGRSWKGQEMRGRKGGK